MYSKLTIAALLSALAVTAAADGPRNSLALNAPGQEGVYNPVVAAGPPPGDCNGAIDFSTGCAQPMAGGL